MEEFLELIKSWLPKRIKLEDIPAAELDGLMREISGQYEPMETEKHHAYDSMGNPITQQIFYKYDDGGIVGFDHNGSVISTETPDETGQANIISRLRSFSKFIDLNRDPGYLGNNDGAINDVDPKDSKYWNDTLFKDLDHPEEW